MLLSLLIAAPVLAAPSAQPPACTPSHLRLSQDGQNGDFNGMSHSGTALSIRNLGPDCTVPALPLVTLRDARGRALPATRRPPVGMHPGPVMLPLRLAAGHRAEIDLRWVSGPVYPQSRSVRVARVAVRIGTATLTTPLTAMVYGETGKPLTFDQTPLRTAEGMAAG